ncbi:CBO0543 family protein [Mesobacillus thioparans]|uniref:CBO0543 family protein n=1 Tax=Mesobacillus thioparans TaxID=370439 RepID=UPI0039EE9D45
MVEAQTIFVLISSFILALVAYMIPKKMKKYEIYATSIFAALFGLLVDTVLAIKYKFYVLDQPGVQIPPLVGQVILYSATSIILLNLYPYDKSIKSRVVYILTFAILAIAFELLSLHFGFIKYREWKLWYSALCYPFLICFLVLHYRFFQWLVKRET